MLITLKMYLHTLLLPPGGPLLVAALAVWLLRVQRPAAQRGGWVLLIASLLSLWLLATPAVSDALARATQRYPALDLQRPVDAQAVVILGGATATMRAREYGGAPAPRALLLERVDYAAYVVAHTGLPVLVSGDATEAAAMQASLARDFHIETRWVENRSRDTFENAEFSARILKAAGIRRIVLVTDANHEWRAAHEFASTGLEVTPAPAALGGVGERGPMRWVPDALCVQQSTQALYELSGDLARRAMQWLGVRRQVPVWTSNS
jgi:uncharacterized SAM-binding protein YcdF (DUF218 family)